MLHPLASHHVCLVPMRNLNTASLSQIFPNADLRLLKGCVSVRDKLLQKEYDKHKARPAIMIEAQECVSRD